jgi:hypothetical protein
MATEAIQDCKSGRVSSIVLVGHSLAASAAVSMAEQLQQAGLHVALMVTFDPVVRTTVPDNVHLLRNFYISNGLGTAVRRGEHFHGLLQNVGPEEQCRTRTRLLDDFAFDSEAGHEGCCSCKHPMPLNFRERAVAILHDRLVGIRVMSVFP